MRETASAVVLRNAPVLLVACEDITERKRAEEGLRIQAERLQTLYSANLALTQTLDLPALLERLLDIAYQLCQHDGMSIILLDDEGTMRVRASRGYGPDQDPRFVVGSAFDPRALPLIGRVLRSRITLVIPDTREERDWVVVRGAEHARCWLGAPLVAGGTVIGLFSMDKAQPGFFTADHQYMAESLAAPAGFAIQNARLHQQAQTYAQELAQRVAELKKAEEAVRRSETELRDVIDLVPGHVWSTLPDGSVDFINQRWREFTGLPVDRAIGWNWEAIVHPDDRARFVGDWHAALKSGRSMEGQARVRRADGEYRWWLIRSVPLRDGQGAIVKWYGIGVDVEDCKRAEQALRRSEAYLADAQHLTHTGSWAYNPATGKPTYWSEEMFRIYGVESRRRNAPDDDEYRGPMREEYDRLRAIADKAFREKADLAYEHTIVLPAGTTKHLQAIAHPVLDETGEVVEYVGTTIDVTGRKRAEEERERLRQLEADLAHMNRVTTMGELTASLAHDVNQPIAAAMMDANTCLRWLNREKPDLDEAREAATRTANDATRAAGLISRMRRLFKKSAPEHELVNVNELVAEIVTLVRSEARRYRVAIRTDLAADLPPLMGDRIQLQQVVLNLLMNSIEAMKEVDGHRDIAVASRRDGSDHLLVSVADTGVGLPENVDEIFNPFVTTKAEGTGMGLAISRSIIESHRGRLWATANAGRGATFCFRLPAVVTTHV